MCCWPRASSDDVYMVGKLAAFEIQNLLVAYKERFDKDNFIKNLLVGQSACWLIFTIVRRSLHIEAAVRRVVFLIETKNEKDTNALETVTAVCFPANTRTSSQQVDEKNIIVVKEVKPNE